MKNLYFFLFSLFFLLYPDSVIPIERSYYLMGTILNVEVKGKNSKKVLKEIVKEIKHLENIFSLYKKDSYLTKLNLSYNKRITVIFDFKYLFLKAKKVYNLTSGYFDISILPFINFWREKEKKGKIPEYKDVQKEKSKTGLYFINLKGDTLYFKKKLTFDFSGIAKGYALEKAKEIFMKNKVKEALLNFGGQILVYSKKNKNFWIGIRDPKDKDKTILQVLVKNTSVSTSASYYNYYVFNSKKFSHIINAKTGYPVGFKREKVLSATVIYKDPTFADALSTAFLIMGTKSSFSLTKKLKGIKIIIMEKYKGGIKIIATKNLKSKIKIKNKDEVKKIVFK